MKKEVWGAVLGGPDQDEVKGKGMVRIAALAEWMNGSIKPRADMIERRIKSYSKDYRMSEQEVKEMLADATMAIKKGKSAYQYLTEGQPAHFLSAGKYMKYVKGITPEEYASVQREISLSEDGQKILLKNPNQVTDMTEEQKNKVRESGGVPNYTAGDQIAGRIGKVF